MAKGRAKAGVAALDRSPGHLLHRALQLALDLYAAETGPGGLTQRQYAVLAAAAAREGATQSDLVRVTGIDRSTLADLAARLMAKGLLARERSPTDGRANAVRLTEAGRAALADTQPRALAADERLMALIPRKGRREAFVEVLQQLAAAEPGAAAELKRKKPAKAKLKSKKKLKAAA